MGNYTLIPRQEETEPENEKKPSAVAEKKAESKPSAVVETKSSGGAPPPVPIGWTVDGVPVGDPTVVKAQWETGLFSCLGKNDEFYSSDVEVCEFFSIFFLKLKLPFSCQIF